VVLQMILQTLDTDTSLVVAVVVDLLVLVFLQV
jgi:hypothetical protein